MESINHPNETTTAHGHQTQVMVRSPADAAPCRMVRMLPLANRNFRLLWMGENISLFGDQFYFIALPWLVFQMTRSVVAFGTILMVTGIPRAVFMLLGGVITDRFSPRTVMIVSNLCRLVIMILLTLIVISQAFELWMLYVIAFGFGSVDAFFHPAYRAIIPFIVDEDNLQAGVMTSVVLSKLLPQMCTNAGRHLVCFLRIAVCVAVHPIVCRGFMTKKPWMCWQSSHA